MDTLTHMLIGAGTAQLIPSAVHNEKQAPTWQQKAMIGALAAIFPDIDYLLFPLDPLAFLAYWHRAHSHSIFLAPLWAYLLTLVLQQYFKRNKTWSGQRLLLFWISLSAILSHIISDSLTVYGTRWFSPLLDIKISWDLLFVVDIYFTATILAALILLIRWRDKSYRAYACLIPFVYLGLVLLIKSTVYHRLPVSENSTTNSRISAPSQAGILVPQPFSPFYWQLIKADGPGFKQAYLKLADDIIGNKLSRLSGSGLDYLSYRFPREISWRRYPIIPDNPDWQADAETVWQNEKFTAFRDFTKYPVFYAYNSRSEKTCVWFSDLRYHWPGMLPTFRFGMCKKATGAWQVHRMKYFSRDQLQSLR
ncbi:metal-dependent hydrolase [Thalassomonas sp. RHCl1]|uniref:metal-dependent hydrolase n=1 Tax=Thalassomonas sp. RHCl1 TaxID=2995320 RepID=UPI00248CA9B8|nr:metal-dependent hydrolase [Thalassomonas sp. RHCl1]